MVQTHAAKSEPAEDPLGTRAILLEIVKKLSSQALLFGLAVIVILVGAWYLFGAAGLPIILAILAVFLVVLFAYLFAEEKRKATAGALAWVGSERADAPAGDLTLELWTEPAAAPRAGSRDVGVVPKSGAAYRVGDAIGVGFRASRDCYLTLLNLGTSGGLTILFPNAHQRENFVRSGDPYHIPAADSGFEFRLQGPPGTERLKAVATLSKVLLLESHFAPDGAIFDTRPASATPRDIAVVQRRVERLQPQAWAEATTEFTVTG